MPSPPEDTVTVGMGKFLLTAHGSTVVTLLAIITLGAMTWYHNDHRRQEHDFLLRSHDLMTCVLTLSQEQRNDFRQHYKPGVESIWCPWVRNIVQATQ